MERLGEILHNWDRKGTKNIYRAVAESMELLGHPVFVGFFESEILVRCFYTSRCGFEEWDQIVDGLTELRPEVTMVITRLREGETPWDGCSVYEHGATMVIQRRR